MAELKSDALQSDNIRINFRNRCDGIEMLKQIGDSTLKVVFFDPQYRGVLDSMKYGNKGKAREKNRCALPQMSAEVIVEFFQQIERVLRPSGYLFLWVDKFHLVEGISLWSGQTELVPVDLITWNKLRIGMGYRTRRKSEYLIVLQKLPKLAKATWTLHNIPDVWDEKVVKTHAHSKPVELQKQLILATTKAGDYICDPASGGYSVLEACMQTGRNFIGCDIKYGEET